MSNQYPYPFCPYKGTPVGFNLPWTTYHPECINFSNTGITEYDLNMRRKAEILQYNKNQNRPTKKEQWSMLNRGVYNKRKAWATQSLTNTNPNTLKLEFSQNNPETNILVCNQTDMNPAVIVNSSTASNVPGKPINLYLNPNVPLTLWKRQYTYLAGNSKWPQTTS